MKLFNFFFFSKLLPVKKAHSLQLWQKIDMKLMKQSIIYSTKVDFVYSIPKQEWVNGHFNYLASHALLLPFELDRINVNLYLFLL